jgi:WD40 repeat protein
LNSPLKKRKRSEMKAMRRCIYLSSLIVAVSSVVLLLAFARSNAQPEAASADVWRGHEAAVTDLTFSPNGEWLASSSLDGTVRLWKVATGRVERVVRSHNDEIFALAFSRDGRFIASTGYDRRVIISNAGTGETVHLLSGFEGWSRTVAFSPDGSQVAASSTDGKIWIWSVESGKQIRTIESKNWQTTLAWSPDGKYLASGWVNITIWDVATGQRVRNLEGHGDEIRSLSFSPDGRLLASAGLDKTARIWKVESGALLQTLEPTGFVYFSSRGPVNSSIRVPVLAVAFSADGKQLATGGADRLVRLWEVSSGKPIRTLQGHTMTVTGVAFSPDGKRLATSSLDRTIRIWQLE